MYVYVLLYGALQFSNRIFSKLCSNEVRGGGATYSAYYAVHSLVACIFFAISGGFSVSVNLPTLIYSVAFAAIILVNMLVGMLILRKVNILGSSILASPFSIAFTAITGALIFSEEITYATYVRIAIMAVASACIYLDIRRQNKRGARDGIKTNITAVIVLMSVSIILSALQLFISKSFALSTTVTDEHSFFLLTNLIMLISALLAMSVQLIKNPRSASDALVIFKPRVLFPSVANVVSSNASSLVMIPLLEVVNVSIFSPVSAAFGIVVSVVSSLCFKEKLGVFSYLGAAVAIAAMLIT